jgi:cystathionine beta-lyase/cystathionine gamma-synthase
VCVCVCVIFAGLAVIFFHTDTDVCGRCNGRYELLYREVLGNPLMGLATIVEIVRRAGELGNQK